MGSKFWNNVKSHWIEIASVAFVFFLSLGFVIGLSVSQKDKSIALVKRQSETVLRLDLSKEGEERDISIDGAHGIVIISVKKDYIRAKESNCPGQDCVHLGWIKAGGKPIICAYNGVAIYFEEDGGNSAILG